MRIDVSRRFWRRAWAGGLAALAVGGWSCEVATEQNRPVAAKTALAHDFLDEATLRRLMRDAEPQLSVLQAPPGFRPDLATDVHEASTYVEHFVPALTPFQRWVGLDTVRLANDAETPVLVDNGSALRRRLTVTQAVEGGRDAGDVVPTHDEFVGLYKVDRRYSDVHRLPAAAPQLQLLALETKPAVGVHLEQDAADNLWAVFAPGAVATVVELRYRVAVRRDYFAMPSIPDVPSDVLSTLVPAMPATVRRQALKLASSLLGLHFGQSMRRVLPKLVGHFRAYVVAPQPTSSAARGDVLSELVLGQRGLCRHRAYGFVILAQALGIPARFVHNEAHAWAEVALPEPLRWLRIDLGGAVDGVTFRGVGAGPMHRPTFRDVLPRPLAYRQAIATAARRFQAEQRHVGASSSNRAQPLRPPTKTATGRRLHVQLATQRWKIRRGETLRVFGSVVDDEGRGIGDLPIEVWLDGERRVATSVVESSTRSDAQGRFAADLRVPATLPVGNYGLRVRSSGSLLDAVGERDGRSDP